MEKSKEEIFRELILRAWPEFTVVKRIGMGSYGSVYECERNDIASREAVKCIQIPASEDQLTEFARSELDPEAETLKMKNNAISEVEMMMDLKSPHIAHINDFRVFENPADNRFSYILIRMDLYESLNALQDKVKSCSQDEAVSVAAKVCLDICDALIYCEAKGIMHRDIKPENIMVSANHEDFFLADFGIAKKLQVSAGSMTVAGTENYMAPEIMKRSYMPNADIYSLGIVLYQLVNYWRTPFLPNYPKQLSKDDYEFANKRRNNGEYLPDPANSTLVFADIIRKMCAYNPDERFESARDVKAAVLAMQRGEIPVPHQDVISRHSARPDAIPQNRNILQNKSLVFGIAAIIAAVLVICIVTAAVVSVLNNRNASDAAAVTDDTILYSTTEAAEPAADAPDEEETVSEQETITEQETAAEEETTAANAVDSLSVNSSSIDYSADTLLTDLYVNYMESGISKETDRTSVTGMEYSLAYMFLVTSGYVDYSLSVNLNQKFDSFEFYVAYDKENMLDGATLFVEIYASYSDSDEDILLFSEEYDPLDNPGDKLITLDVSDVSILKIVVNNSGAFSGDGAILIANGILYLAED